MAQKKRIVMLALGLAPLFAAGCSTGRATTPGGTTEALVFFTPQVREARAQSGDVFRSQHAEFARRDHLLGAEPERAATLYQKRPETYSVTRREQVRLTSTSDGYRLTERSSVTATNGRWGHRRR